VPCCALVAGGGRRGVLAAADALDAGDPHQPPDLIPPKVQPGACGGVPHLPHPIHAPIPPIDIHDRIHQVRIFPFRRGDPARQPSVICLRGDLHVVFGQHGTDRLDPETVSILVDVP